MATATLNALPPLDPDAPFAAFGYLQGYVRRRRPDIGVRTRYWNGDVMRAVDPRGRGWSLEQWYAFCAAAFTALAIEVEAPSPDAAGARDDAARGRACEQVLATQGALRGALDAAEFRRLVDAVAALVCDELQAMLRGVERPLVACSLEFHQEVPSIAFLRLAKACCPRAITVIGGRLDVQLARRLVESFAFIDACVYDEGPAAFLALCERAQRGEGIGPGGVPGAVWRDGDRVRVSEPSALQSDIDEHFADYDGFDFAAVDREHAPEQVIGIWDSRGCWWQRCSFCNRSGLDLPARFRSADSVLREVEAHLAAHAALAQRPVCVFLLGAESIGKDANRFAELLRGLDGLRQRRGRLTVAAIISPVRLDDEIVALLDRLRGQLIIGFERWDDMLASMNKPHRVEHGIRAIKLLSRYPRVRYNFPLLIGHPGDTLAGVDEMTRNIWRMRYLLGSNRPQFNVTPVETYRCSSLGHALGFDDEAVIDMYERAPITALLALLGAESRTAAELLTYRYPLPNRDLGGTLSEATRRLHEVEGRLSRATPTLTVQRDDSALRIEMDEGARRSALELPFDAAARVLAATEWITTERALEAALGDDGWAQGEPVVAALEEHDLLYRDQRRKAMINTLPAAAQRRVTSWAGAA